MSGAIRRKLMEAKRPSTNIEQWYKHATNLAEKTGDPSTKGTNRDCSNRRSKKNKCSDDTPKSAGSICTSTELICHGGG